MWAIPGAIIFWQRVAGPHFKLPAQGSPCFNAEAPLTQIAFGTGHPLSDQNTVSFSV